MINRPRDPYDPRWPAYWRANPLAHKSVGADAAEDSGEVGGEGSEAGKPGDAVAEWAAGISDEGLKGVAGKYENQDAFLKAAGYEAPKPTGAWDGIPDDLKEIADRFTSPAEALRAVRDLRKRESQVRLPGKDATEEEKSAYLKAIGVPESPTDYEFPEEGDVTDAIKASHEAWGKRFIELGVPKDTAKQLANMLQEDVDVQLAAEVEADKEFAKSQEDALKAEWKGEQYGINMTLAGRAVTELANRAGLNVEELKKIETKDGRFLLDRADMLKLFAPVGREMAEGTLGPAISEGERETIEDQLRGLREKQTEAQGRGDSKRANQLYQREQALLAKLSGNRPVVGVGGRVV